MNTSIIPQSTSDWQVLKFGTFKVLVQLDSNGDPTFDAAYACKILGIKNVSDAVNRLDEDEHAIIVSNENGVPVRHLTLTLAGLNHLINTTRPRGSNKEQVHKFQRWVNHDVLPSIYTTGSYSIVRPEPDQLTALEGIVAYLRGQDNRLKALESQVPELHEKLANITQTNEAINARLDNREYFTVRAYCEINGIKYTTALLQLWGKQAANLSRERGIQIRKQEVENRRWATENLYHQSILAEACGKIPPKPGQSELL